MAPSLDAVERPARWFAGYTAVRAEPGQRATVDVVVEPHLLRHWSPQDHVWRTEAGTYRLMVGRSAGHIRWEGPVTLHGSLSRRPAASSTGAGAGRRNASGGRGPSGDGGDGQPVAAP
ncbi:fibronectin type III-like domain-contianing protein [Streptomyces sp. NPDC049915]|uniref:fibronectin type III-like domain-contianing protein n=1 Tax=Streptomyces sp. NPDC049915 TaxID=3155510 RepID=UPI0034444094